MIGTVQGRLTPAPKNRLQFFPKNWRFEFAKARDAKIDYIEFFSERKLNNKNPIWSDDLIKEYLDLAQKNNLKIYSFVDDYIISNSLFLKRTQIYVKNLIQQISKLKVKYLILPLYGKSRINSKNLKKFILPLKSLILFAKKRKVKILVESNFSFTFYKQLLKQLNFADLKIVFDTGNRINLKSNIYSDLLLFNRYVKHIHIKDKDNNNKNVKLTNGKVDFKQISKILKKIKYSGNFTIESTRGRSPVKRLTEYKKYLNSIGIY